MSVSICLLCGNFSLALIYQTRGNWIQDITLTCIMNNFPLLWLKLCRFHKSVLAFSF